MPKLSVIIVGEATGLKAAFAEAGVAAGSFETRIKSLAGTALKLTASMIGIGGGLIAFEGLKKSISDAEAFDAALRSTDTAIKNTGGSLSAYSATVTSLADKGAKLGYTNTQILQGFQTLTLVTGNATDAVKYMSLAEDIAKAKGIDLASAATAVGKAIDGKTTSLQRYGIVIAKGEPIEQALADAQARYAGQAVANTTATQQLSATVSDLEVKIGQALLPSVQHIATAIETWIADSKNQKKVTDDVREAVSIATGVFNVARGAIHAVDSVTGSFKNTLEALLALKVASMLSAWTGGFGILAGATGIGGAEVAASGLLGSMTALEAIGPIAIPITLLITDKNVRTSGSSFLHDLTTKGTSFGKTIGDDAKFVASLAPFIAPGGHFNLSGGATPKGTPENPVNPKLFPSLLPGTSTSALASITSPAKEFAAAAERYQKTHPATTPLGAYTVPQALATALSKATAGRGGSVASAQDAIIANINKLLKSGQIAPGSKAAQEAYDELASIQNKQTAAAKKGASYKIPDALEAAIRKAQQTFADSVTKQHLDTLDSLLRQEENLLKSHGELAKAQSVANEITKANLKASGYTLPADFKVQQAKADALAALTGGSGPTQLQLRLAKEAKTVSMKAIDSNTLSLQGLVSAWQQVQQDNTVIASSLSGLTNSYHAVSTLALTQGLGLTRNARVTLEERLAQSAAHRGYAPSGPAAYGQEIHVTIHSDVDAMVTKVEKRQRQTHQRTGARR